MRDAWLQAQGAIMSKKDKAYCAPRIAKQTLVLWHYLQRKQLRKEFEEVG